MPQYSPAVLALSEFLKANATLPPMTGWPRAGSKAEPRKATA